MKTLAFALLLTFGFATEAFGQQVVIVQPRRQSNSLWNPANPNRPWVDYRGRTGREREAATVKQWIVTPVPNRFPGAFQGPIVIVNPFVK